MLNKTFHVVDNRYPLSISTSKNIKQLLLKKGWKYDTKNHNYLFVVGGDGTLVRTLNNYYSKKTQIICVNTGNIGFYAKLNHSCLNKLDELVTNPANYIHPDILEISIDSKKIYAINEVVIQALNTVEMDITIDDIFYETFKGTGVLICTKTGSTGQAKTNGGAIITPNTNAIQLIELAPTLHANKVTITSPLVLDDKSKIELMNFKFNQRTDVVADGILRSNLKSTNVIKIRMINANFNLFFSLKLDEYVKKLHKTFISLL